MKKVWKRLSAAVLTAAVMMAGMTGCSQTPTWAVREGDRTLPVGTYICNVITAYQSALYQSDMTQDLFTQQVEGKDAATWIKDQALRNTKGIFYLDNKLEEMGITLSDEENDQIESLTSSAWSQLQSTLEPYGVSKDSFEMAYSGYSVKMSVLFDKIYGEGGEKAVSEEEITAYFNDNYTHFEYLMVPLFDVSASTSSSSSETSSESSSEESEEVTQAKKALFDEYAAKINSGEMTMEEAAEAFKTTEYSLSEESALQTYTLENSTLEASYPEEFRTALGALQAGKAGTAEIELTSGNMYFLIYTDDISNYAEEYLSDATNHENVLVSMKYDEFSDGVDAEIEAMDIEVNPDVVKQYDPTSMFQ